MSRSLIPSLLGLDWWNAWDYPAQIEDQHIGLGLSDDEFLPSRIYRGCLARRRRNRNRVVPYSALSEISNTSEKFQVSTDVSHFNPEDITVKTVDNYVLIHAKHEEKADEHGLISREFTRKYMLPKDSEPEAVVCSLSSDGVLTVEAPKTKRQLASNERVIPIMRKETLEVTNEEKKG